MVLPDSISNMDGVSREFWGYVPQYSDVGSTRGMGATRWFERYPGEPPSYAGHTFGISRPGKVMEALHTVVESDWSTYLAPCEVHRCNKFTPSQLKTVATFARRKFLYDRYGYLKIPTQAADNLTARAAYHLYGRTGDLHAFRRLQCLRYSFPNCHGVWAIPFKDVLEYEFGVHEWQTNPDQINDFMRQSSDWDLVFKRVELAA